MAFNSSEWTIDYTGSTVTNNDSGIGDNLPVNTGGTWFVGEIGDFFRWIANDFASGNTMKYSYPIDAITPTVYQWKNGWYFGHNDDYKYLQGGSIESSGSTTLFSNLYSIGTQTDGSQLYIIQNDTELDPWWISGNIDILVKVKENAWITSDNADGTSIDGGLWVFDRETGNFFDHNFIDLSGGGRNPISINTSIDSNNISGEIYITVASSTGFVDDNFIKGGTSGTIAKIAKIDGNNIYLNSVRFTSFVTSETITEYTDRELTDPTGQSTTNDGAIPFTNVISEFDNISITFTGVTKDLNNGNDPQPYEVVIDCSGETLSNVYEYLKYVVRYNSSGTTYTIQGDDGQEYRNASGTTWLDVKTAPFGTFAGGKFFGARGVWIENMHGTDITNYQLTDSNNVTQSPPVQYSLILTNLKANSEIRIYTGSTNEIAGVEDSTDSFTYLYTYTSDFDVDIVIHHIDYVYIRIYSFTLSNTNSSIPIQQRIDNWYENP